MMSHRERLQSARQTLQDTYLPFQIRVVSYLRLSCFILDEHGKRYAKLMRALCHHNAEWWNTCEITMTGELWSNEPPVNDLLRPIAELHRQTLSSIQD